MLTSKRKTHLQYSIIIKAILNNMSFRFPAGRIYFFPKKTQQNLPKIEIPIPSTANENYKPTNIFSERTTGKTGIRILLRMA